MKNKLIIHNMSPETEFFSDTTSFNLSSKFIGGKKSSKSAAEFVSFDVFDFNILLLTVSCEHLQPEDGATAPSVQPVVIKTKWKLWDAGRHQHFITSVIFICCVFTDLPAV